VSLVLALAACAAPPSDRPAATAEPGAAQATPAVPASQPASTAVDAPSAASTPAVAPAAPQPRIKPAPPMSDPLPAERVPDTEPAPRAAPQLDTSGRRDADCTVKNVGNCCGMQPRCVNVNAAVDPQAVQAECARRGMASVCGFKPVESCECKQGQCHDVPMLSEVR
jgi:hypothetical protein